MALSQTDLDNLEAALASGELSVEYEGRRVTFRSVDDLSRSIAYVKNALAAAAAGGAVTQSYIQHDRGL